MGGEPDWRYAQPRLNASGWLAVTSPHRIYWEEYGHPAGEPVVFLHGGPGGATIPAFARVFDPARYRILLFDQRGCGKSTPSAADADPRPALTHNTTPEMIADIFALRVDRGISGPMHVFGGSWGSTLALAYATFHPETVANLILRGIFLCRRVDLDYFYQGNAARYAQDPRDPSLPGAYLSYPEAWAPFVEAIPAAERDDMIAAYARIFAGDDAAAAERAAIAWSVWEGSTSYLVKPQDDKFGEPAFARAFAQIENHYFMNGAFLGGSGDANRNQNYLLENIARLKDIPVAIAHGRYDQVCPLFQAEALVAALRASGNSRVDYRITVAAHSLLEPANLGALTDIMDTLPPLTR